MKLWTFVTLCAICGVGIHLFLGERTPVVLVQYVLYSALVGACMWAILGVGGMVGDRIRKFWR